MENKYILAFFLVLIALGACSTTIPLQTNLDNQTLLSAENKNMKANFTLTSEIPDGVIEQVYVNKSGSETRSQELNYQPATAFNDIWSSYFNNKFNDFSTDQMNIDAVLVDLHLKENSATSVGVQLLTGNKKSNVEAVAVVDVEVEYLGEIYETQIEVSSSEYQETQSTNYGTISKENPMEQRSLLLQSVLNRSIVQFDNFVSQVLASQE